MKRRALICSLAAAAAAASPLSHAEYAHFVPRAHFHDAVEHRQAHAYLDARGPEFRRGNRLPLELRAPRYVVRDWRYFHLAPPPRGYEWVQVGPDFVLVAVASGLIVDLALNH